MNILETHVVDCIHGVIPLDAYAWKIIHDPIFTRLKRIRQLVCDNVYISATHSRYEHSIGTYFIASHWMQHLKPILITLYTPEDTEIYIRAVKIAALVHDLGHVAMSHAFDDVLANIGVYSHEIRGADMFANIECGLSVYEVELIRSIITGQQNIEDPQFLYQIVNNKRDDLDVDKLDYLLRDSKYTNRKVTFDWKELIRTSSVSNGEICFHESALFNIYSVFQDRFNMFRHVYFNESTLKYLNSWKAVMTDWAMQNEAAVHRIFNNPMHSLMATDTWLIDRLLKCIVTSERTKVLLTG